MDQEMWETKILEWVNLPALILSTPARVWDHTIYIRRGFGLLSSDFAYLVTTGLFWWWVGKQIEKRWRPTGSVERAVYYALTFLGMLMVVGALTIWISTRGLDSSVINGSVSLFSWGIFLSGFFVYRIRRLNSLEVG